MIILPQQQSFHPPAGPDVGASHPDHVLLTVRAYIADRKNETTASSFTREGHRVQVTFFAAKPPALSYLCVYCPDAAFTSEPRVVASQDSLILLGTGTRSSSSDPYGEETGYDYFVYRADDPSSLDLLPETGRHHIRRANVVLVASAGSGGGYAVVTLDPDPSCKRYILRAHREKTGRWRRKIVSRKLLPTAPPSGREAPLDEVLPFSSTKAVALRGSTVAWADLRRAVLLLDVLADDPIAHYIPLPEPLNDRNRERLDSVADPCSFRDVVGGGDSIKFVEMEYRYRYDADGFVPAGWKPVTRGWIVGSKEWRTDSVVDFDDVARNSGGLLPLLCPDGSSGVEVESTKSVPAMCVPALCERDNVLYLMSKPGRRGFKGSVAAVDTGKGTLEEVAPMSDERVPAYAMTYIVCAFSEG